MLASAGPPEGGSDQSRCHRDGWSAPLGGALPNAAPRRPGPLLAAACAAGLAGLALAGCSGPERASPPPSGTAAPEAPAPEPSTGPSAGPSAEPPAALPDPPGPTTSALDAGAAGDGATDDLPALQAALDALAPGEALVLDEGSTFAVSGVLEVRVDGAWLVGGGTLLSTDEEASSLLVTGDDVTVQGVTLAVEATTRRWDAYEQQRLRIDAARGVTVRGVAVEGSAAAGVYVGGGSTGFLLEDLAVSDTRADGIHITQGSSSGVVRRPVVTRSGDDGVAVVSYAEDGEPSRDIAVESPVVRTTTGGRGISVVGGERVTYTDVDIDGSAAAAVYIAAEESFGSTGVSGVVVRGGTVTGANQDAGIDHGAVLVFESAGEGVSDVTVTDLDITGTREGASRQVGVLAGDGSGVRGVDLSDLRLSGGPERLLETTGTVEGLVDAGWTVDGEPVADPAAG
jgi:hypothetical protein